MTGLSTRWPSQWLHFLNFLSPKWLCYKASLTHPKCTKSHLQRSKFQKKFLGRETPGPPLLRGPLRGGGGGEEGEEGEVEGRGGERGGDVEVPRKWSASPGHALALGGPDRRTLELHKKEKWDSDEWTLHYQDSLNTHWDSDELTLHYQANINLRAYSLR